MNQIPWTSVQEDLPIAGKPVLAIRADGLWDKMVWTYDKGWQTYHTSQAQPESPVVFWCNVHLP